MARTRSYSLDEERLQFAFKAIKTEDDDYIIKALVKNYSMTEPGAVKLLRRAKRLKGLKESLYESYLNEMSAMAAQMPQEVDGVNYEYSNHFFDRVSERGKITLDDIKSMVKKVRTKLKDLPMKGEFLFFSKSLKQGIIASWNAMKPKISFVTFLPPEEDAKDYFAKSGTEKVVMETINKDVTIIYID